MTLLKNAFSDSFEHIEEIFSYEPFFGDPQTIVDDIIVVVKRYLHSDNIQQQIQKAYEFALKAHGDQKRLSGEEYIIHPLKATEILLSIRPDIQTIQACILHDVIEDTPYEYQDIMEHFGKEVADMCEGLSKVSNVRYTNDENQLETIKKTFLAMAKDLRVIFIKISDRIHNIQTLHFHPKKEKQQKIAIETMKIFVPIAKRLGLFRYALYLENGSFKVIHPEEYHQILEYYKSKYKNSQKYIKKGQYILKELLYKEGIHPKEIKARLKSPYRIWTKLDQKYQKMDFEKVLDVFAFRIIVDSISDCYATLGFIHGKRRPIINKIKDYIAIPKFNNYQSLHTTILGMFPFSVEIQIRTKEMDEVAEYGVAAHFLYAEKRCSVKLNEKQSNWMQKLQENISSYSNFKTQKSKENFKDNLNIEFLHKDIFVYTPDGDLIELPQGSTVLDFAFRIHTNVGLRFKNALINGTIRPISFQPKTGDVIKINTYKNKTTATRYWLDFLKTPSARSKLKRFLKDQDLDEYVKKGEEILNKVLESYGLPSLYSNKDLVEKYYKESDFNKILIEIADKQCAPTDIIKDVYPQERTTFHQKRDQEKEKREEKASVEHTKSLVVIDDNKIISYELCPLCKPKSDQRIIARTGKDGIKVHTLACPAIKTLSFDKLIEAHWFGQKANIYTISLVIDVQHESYNLMSLLALFQDFHVSIDNISVEKQGLHHFIVFIKVAYSNPAKSAILLGELKKYSSFLNIKERKIV